MTKQKVIPKKRALHSSAHKKPADTLHKRRAWWFTVLTSGLLIIQFAYNIHAVGSPQILGYATNMSNVTLLSDTNDYRSRQGLPKLAANDSLTRAAQAKAESMITGNYWSHTAPDGTSPWYYFQKVGYQYARAGENLAYGFSTSDQVVTAWMNSPEHRDNVLGDYTEVGFGFANGDHYQNGKNTVIVAFYGLPNNPPLTANTSTAPPEIKGESVANHAALTAKKVSGITTIVAGNAPWATYASLTLIGATLLGFIVTHLETLRLGWRNARKYALLHPALDATVLIVLALVVVQAAGGFIR